MKINLNIENYLKNLKFIQNNLQQYLKKAKQKNN